MEGNLQIERDLIDYNVWPLFASWFEKQTVK